MQDTATTESGELPIRRTIIDIVCTRKTIRNYIIAGYTKQSIIQVLSDEMNRKE